MEHFFNCPHCWENISMILDKSVTEQTYIEDCEVCCNPIEVSTIFKTNTLMGFNAKSIEQ